ncbi:uncharacterized protein BO97DRAFT_431477 [Aspergillus homomorphus CBS 101889]|uniref:AB hydrolase-1 domain-containing protein n=1 Tax=Aspergillus homomorphus (strain CBS 101889) TaxID=1450537 RepID=A0A395IBW0_ASPHC|nr:hypothetical protein BO97DRAFT_431477 [Aspergillus homomorphus CBS 101889]RAL16633.1 hypothetical protein BO97DRAFT_431477 [Aspergillus homomorphus CBS 101889]
MVHCLYLPSCANSSPPPVTYHDDVTVVRDLVTTLVNKGERILMIFYSYGGAGLDLPSRVVSNFPGGIIYLLYMSVYIQQLGRSIWDDNGSTFHVDSVQLFLGDCDEARVATVLSHQVRSLLSVFETPSSGDSWRRLPVMYDTMTKDYSVSRVYQDIMLKYVKEGGWSVVILRQEVMLVLVEKVVLDARNP